MTRTCWCASKKLVKFYFGCIEYEYGCMFDRVPRNGEKLKKPGPDKISSSDYIQKEQCFEVSLLSPLNFLSRIHGAAQIPVKFS